MHAQLTPEIASEEYRQRFWSHVDKRGPDDCWEWTRYRNHARNGYGRVGWVDFNTRQSHRVAYALTYGDPGNFHVLHRCDNPPCCNPGHLFLGRDLDNVADMIAKERRTFHGTTNMNAKLDDEKVRAIRTLCAGGVLAVDVAQMYGVNASAIGKIVRRERWAHVAD